MIIALISVAAVAIILAVGCIISMKKSADLNRLNAVMTERLKTADAEIQRLKSAIDEAKRFAEEEKTSQGQGFELIARKIIEEQSSSLRESQTRELNTILQPLKDDINGFRQKVEECYGRESRERFSLDRKIKELIDANAAISRQAHELSTALRGNSKVQGDWGEMVLETILDKSGLRKGEEYTVQQTVDESGHVIRDDSGRHLRPDVVVRYPGKGFVIIDSKVSLTAFVNHINADNDDERDLFLKRHVDSVVKHINELSVKNYQDFIENDSCGKLDFVMMFIPNEAAYATALQADPTLWQKAFDKRVLMVSPTQLVGALRIIEQLWSHEKQTRHAMEIAKASGDLYDKFAGFLDDMQRIDKTLSATQTAFGEAMKKLSQGKGNLISRAEKIRQLGVKTKKRLPSADNTEGDQS